MPIRWILFIAMAGLLTSCQMTVQDLDEYKNDLKAESVNSNLEDIIEYLNEPLENAVVYPYAMESGAYLVKNQLTSDLKPEINQANTVLSSSLKDKIKAIYNEQVVDEEEMMKAGIESSSIQSHCQAWAIHCLDMIADNNDDIFVVNAFGDNNSAMNYQLQVAAGKYLMKRHERIAIQSTPEVIYKLALIQHTAHGTAYTAEQQHNIGRLIEYLKFQFVNLAGLNKALNLNLSEVADTEIKAILIGWGQDYILDRKVADKALLTDYIKFLSANAGNSSALAAACEKNLLDLAPATFVQVCLAHVDISYLKQGIKALPLCRTLQSLKSESGFRQYNAQPYLDEKTLFGKDFYATIDQQFQAKARELFPKLILKESADVRKEYYTYYANCYPVDFAAYIGGNFMKYSPARTQLAQDLNYAAFLLSEKVALPEADSKKLVEMIAKTTLQIANRDDSAYQLKLTYHSIPGKFYPILMQNLITNSAKLTSSSNWQVFFNVSILTMQHLQKQKITQFDEQFQSKLHHFNTISKNETLGKILKNYTVFDEKKLVDLLLADIFAKEMIKSEKLYTLGEFLKSKPKLKSAKAQPIFKQYIEAAKSPKDSISLVATKLLVEMFMENEEMTNEIAAQVAKRWPNILGE